MLVRYLRALEAAVVTLLGAFAGLWSYALRPTLGLHSEGHRVGELLQAIWGAGIAGFCYLAFRFWGLVRQAQSGVEADRTPSKSDVGSLNSKTQGSAVSSSAPREPMYASP
jgi:threonine/homoserine/homoserine lactone efflux protein